MSRRNRPEVKRQRRADRESGRAGSAVAPLHLVPLAVLEEALTWYALDLSEVERKRITDRIVSVAGMVRDRWALNDDDATFAQDVLAPVVIVSEWKRAYSDGANPDSVLDTRLRDLNTQFSRKDAA